MSHPPIVLSARPIVSCVVLAALLFGPSAVTCIGDDPQAPGPIASSWPRFRGPNGSGVSGGRPPVEWNVSTGENVAWKRRVGGLGHSCPIGIDDRIFLTTAVSLFDDAPEVPRGFLLGTGKSAADSGEWRWQVASFDARSGVEIWRRTVATGIPTIQRHLKSTHANSTPATDGHRLVACFGSEGVYCFSLDGDVLWKKDFGRLHSGPYDAPELEWGFGSSPIIHDDRVILQCDCLNVGFVVVLNLEDGSEVLRIPRDDVATWSTPAILKTDTCTQLVCNGYRQMASYDLQTGESLWTLHGGGDVPVPSPIVSGSTVILTNAHGRSPVYAVSAAARGDVTPDKADESPEGLLWWEPRGGSYIPTPIVVGELLYTCSDRGILTVRSLGDGELVYRERIGRQFTASAVATAEHVYFSGEDGRVVVVKTGTECDIVAENDFEESIFATPAILGDRLIVRTGRHLYGLNQSRNAGATNDEPPKDEP